MTTTYGYIVLDCSGKWVTRHINFDNHMQLSGECEDKNRAPSSGNLPELYQKPLYKFSDWCDMEYVGIREHEINILDEHNFKHITHKLAMLTYVNHSECSRAKIYCRKNQITVPIKRKRSSLT